MTEEQLKTLRSRMLDATALEEHYDGCWESHAECALLMVLDELDQRLEKEYEAGFNRGWTIGNKRHRFIRCTHKNASPNKEEGTNP